MNASRTLLAGWPTNHRSTGSQVQGAFDYPESVSPNQIPQNNGVWACTIIARNYLPAARVLATSFLSHHPGGRMFVLVLDDNLGELDGNEPFEVLHLDDLAIEPAELHTMAACYSVMELATAVKPWLLETLLRRGTPSVLYLDPDIQVFHSLKELSDLAEEHNIVLTPHVTAPMPRDQKMTSETAILAIWDLQPGLYRSQSRRWALPPILDESPTQGVCRRPR